MRGWDVRTNLQSFLQDVDRKRLDQVPQALAWTINACVDAAKPGIREVMAKVFDRPAPYTLNAVYGSYASKRRLEAHLLLKDNFAGAGAAPGAVNKGTAAAVYLAPQIEGGGRPVKRVEAVLRRAGLMPANLYLVPGRECPLDSYGNVPSSFIIRMLSDLQAWRSNGFRANRKDGPRKGWRADNYFFAVPDPRSKRNNSHLKPGIYWQTGRLLLAIFHFTRMPQYRAVFDFYGTAERLARAAFDAQWPIYWKRALDTDRGAARLF